MSDLVETFLQEFILFIFRTNTVKLRVEKRKRLLNRHVIAMYMACNCYSFMNELNCHFSRSVSQFSKTFKKKKNHIFSTTAKCNIVFIFFFEAVIGREHSGPESFMGNFYF